MAKNNNNNIDILKRAQDKYDTKRIKEETMKYWAIYDHSSSQLLDSIEEYLGERMSLENLMTN